MYARQRIFWTSLFALLALAVPFSVFADSLTATERAQLEAELAEVQAEEAQAQTSLTAAESQSSSLQSAINVVAAKIKTEELSIEAQNLLIQTLGDSISNDQSQIQTLAAQIVQNKEDVANAFREIKKVDDESVIGFLLSNQTLSQFINDSVELETLQQGIDGFSTQYAAAEASSTADKNTLTVQQNAAIDARYTIQEAQSALQANETQQKKLLSISQTNAKSYASLLTQQKTEINTIDAKLFALAGGSNPIPFGQAYQYALAAQKSTGIDPAFLLAILTQESNLGTNQGNCYLTNEGTGAGVSVKTGVAFTKVMNPTRDVPPFLTITSDLQVDPLQTVVSCPQSVGWGGAMGPAQFIPSTWMLFTKRIASALGFSGMANPWNPQHAFMASAFYLTDLGAANGGYTAESNAACKYYSGNPCSESALVASYGTSVMALASTIQTTEINNLQSL